MALLNFGYCLCCLSDFSESNPQSCFTNYCETCLRESNEWEINPTACNAHVEEFYLHHGYDIHGHDIPF